MILIVDTIPALCLLGFQTFYNFPIFQTIVPMKNGIFCSFCHAYATEVSFFKMH